MIRLAWRQFRAPAIVALAALVVVGAFAVITGPSLAHAYDVTLAACQPTGDCTTAMRAFALNDSAIRAALTTLVVLVPVLVGAFWGRRSSPARSRRARSRSCGRRASPARAGLSSSLRLWAWPPCLWPGY